jgi:hypothetical protein
MVIVIEILSQDPTQVIFTNNNQVIEALSSNTADQALHNLESEEAKLRLNARYSPQWVLARHPTDQLSNLFVDLRTSNRCLRLPAPIETKASSVPFDDRFGFDDDQDLPPIFPESR